jgi:diketogulonate reductase-like aldo/keto reductase
LRDTGTPRDRVFITTKVTPSNLRYADLRNACERSLRRLQTDYIDLYLIHWPGSVPLADSFRALNELHAEGKIRHIGVSNFDLKLLKEAQSLSRSSILTNQVPYSLTDRSCVWNGVLVHCQANDILLTAYSPVDEGRLRVTNALETVARKHAATPYQIALAWLVRQPRVITIPMSMNPAHIAENFQAADIELDADDLRLLD